MSDDQQGPEFEGGAQPPATPPGEPLQPPEQPYQPSQPPTQPTFANTSGTGGPVPEEIRAMGWSWGAFWLNWIWGIAHNVWLSLLVFCLGIIWMIVLGIKGNEWAWQHRRFDSIEQFKQTQAVWSSWGWIIFFVTLVLSIPLWIMFGAVLIPVITRQLAGG